MGSRCGAGILPHARAHAPSFRIVSAASRPGAPMMPPPGWVPEPHWYIAADRRAVLRPVGHRPEEEQLLERELALEDVALGQADDALDVRRREHLAVEDRALQVRRVLGERVDDRVAERLALASVQPPLRW